MLDLRQLRSFREVAERGTVADAAAALGYTPPAVSQHIAKLESELGALLFDRVGGRLTLTGAGERLLPITHSMADLAHQARATVHGSEEKPNLVIAGFASALAGLVVPKLELIRQTMNLTIVEAEDSAALRDLSLGAVDVVLTQEYTGDPIDRNDRFDYQPLIRDTLRLVLPRGSAASMGLSDAVDRPWLLNGDDTRCTRAARGLLGAAGATPTISGIVSDNEALLELVAAGHGVAVVPELVLDHCSADVVVADQIIEGDRTILAVVVRARRHDVQPLVDLLGVHVEPVQRHKAD